MKKNKDKLLKFNELNYPNKSKESIEIIDKLNCIIDCIYYLEDLEYYFNFDGFKKDTIDSFNLNFCDIGMQLEIIRAFCIDELTYKDKLVQLLKKEENRLYT